MTYAKVEASDIALFRSICAPERVLVEDAISYDYAHDEMPIYGERLPEVLIYAISTQEVQHVIAHCNRRRIPITPRGAGTGLCGGAVAIHGGVLLSTERMNHILEVDEENLTVTVEPGVLLMDLAAHVLSLGLFYPPEPGEKSATLGGNVMTNAGGMKAVKYGVTRDYVLGLEVVLADGRILNMGGKLAKNSSGYSLLNLMVGSEGTLGIATKLILRLIPKPAKMISLLVPFANLEACIATVPKLMHRRLLPVAVEFMQREVILEAEKYLGKSFPDRDADAYLLISFDGANREEVERQCDEAAECCVQAGASDAFYADTPERLSMLWDARGAFLEAVKNSTDEMDECDVVVPRNCIPEFVHYINVLEERHQVRVRYFGHAGDGNIHVYICRDALPESAWRKRLHHVMDSLYEKAVELNGKVSGEHGIGHAKIGFLCASEGDIFMELSDEIKRVFDPNGILNPGKVVGGSNPTIGIQR